MKLNISYIGPDADFKSLVTTSSNFNVSSSCKCLFCSVFCFFKLFSELKDYRNSSSDCKVVKIAPTHKWCYIRKGWVHQVYLNKFFHDIDFMNFGQFKVSCVDIKVEIIFFYFETIAAIEL